jgi:hypothetical protein
MTEPGYCMFLAMAANSPDLLREYDRLYGANLSQRGAALDRMIDESTGRLAAEFEAFAAWTLDVYERLPLDERAVINESVIAKWESEVKP